MGWVGNGNGNGGRVERGVSEDRKVGRNGSGVV